MLFAIYGVNAESVAVIVSAFMHLNPGGTYYFNTTESVETVATALSVFPYGLRVFTFLVVSDSPIAVSKERWLTDLQRYQNRPTAGI